MILARRKMVGQYLQNKKEHRKKTKVDEVELGDSEGEKEAPIKWPDYGIETLIAIDKVEEEFPKSEKKKERKKIRICILDTLLLILKTLID